MTKRDETNIPYFDNTIRYILPAYMDSGSSDQEDQICQIYIPGSFWRATCDVNSIERHRRFDGQT